MKKILIIIYVNLLSAVGLGGSSLEVDASSFAYNGSGIATNNNISINPASILSNTNNKLTFSYNKWFDKVKGNMLRHEFDNKYISLNSYELDDIDLWGDTPDIKPMGSFGTHFVSLAYGHGLMVNNIRLGIQFSGVHSRLYKEKTTALLFSVGLKYDLLKNIKIGSTVKNFGYINSNLEKNKIPFSYGLGFAYNIDYLKSQVMFDYINNDLYGESFKVALNSQISFLKFIFAISSNQHKALSFDRKIFISGGFEFKYRNLAFTYGIIQQEDESLGLPQAFQITWHY